MKRLIVTFLASALFLFTLFGNAEAESGLVVGDEFGSGVSWVAQIPSFSKCCIAIGTGAVLDQLRQAPRRSIVFMSLGTFDAASGAIDVHDRVAAMTFLQKHAAKGQIVTGLLYVYPDSEDLHSHLDTVDTPLNQLGENALCPGSAALDKINASLR